MEIRINKDGKPISNRKIVGDITLNGLRATLIKNGMKEDDIFLDKKGYPITIDDEKTFKVSDVTDDDFIVMIVSQGKPDEQPQSAKIVSDLMIKMKESPKHDMTPSAIKDFTESYTRDLSDVLLNGGLSNTGMADDPMLLDYVQWQYLIDKNNLLSGININEDIPRRSWLQLSTLKNNIPKFMYWDVPTINASSTYSERSSNYVRSKFYHGEANISHPFASASVEGERTERKMKQRETKNLYMIGKSDFPRVLVRLTKDDIVLSGDFLEAVDEALSFYPQRMKACYNKLKNVFNMYGHVWPTEILLGGQLQVTQTKEVTGNFDSGSEENSLKIAIAGKVKMVSGSAGVSLSSAQATNTKSVDELQNKNFTAYGGNTLLAQDSSSWIPSLGSYKSWSVIEMSKIIPAYKLLDKNRASKIDEILTEFENPGELSKFRLKVGDLISLECGNGKYLYCHKIGGSTKDQDMNKNLKKERDKIYSRNAIYNNGTAKIREARFYVSTMEKEGDNDKVSLEAMDGKGYLNISKHNYLVYGEHPSDKAAISENSKFIVTYHDDDGTIALKGNNNLYLCKDGSTVKFKSSSIEDNCMFDVVKIDEL